MYESTLLLLFVEEKYTHTFNTIKDDSNDQKQDELYGGKG
ncbi:Uncharacterised protein [Mycobacteroides abscessus subsp. abscessus]|nr:Uncharacterised protein [Mycobacteroides abscessus subsp. abscessus]